MISAVAPSAMARAITSRTWTEASSTEPCHSASLAISMFLALRNRIRTSSTRRVRHRGVEIIAERVPARQDRPVLDPRFEQAQRGRLGDLERGDGRIGQAFAPQACRRLPTAAGRSRRNRGAAAWPAAWCRRAGWSARADIRSAHNRGSRPARRRAAAGAAARDARLRLTSSLLLARPSMPLPFATGPSSDHSTTEMRVQWKRSCRIWNGHAPHGLVEPNGGAAR